MVSSSGPEDEDDDSESSSKVDQSGDLKDMEGNQSEKSSHSDSENEPMETETNEIEREVTSPVQIKREITVDIENNFQVTENKPKYGEMSPRRQEVMKRLNFPADLLTLRQVDESEFLQTGIPWSVISVAPLPKGSTVGPYQGETVALSSIKPGELVLQVNILFVLFCLVFYTNFSSFFLVISWWSIHLAAFPG